MGRARTRAVLALVAVLHVYWAAGGTWALSEALGGQIDDSSAALQLAAAVIALLVVGAALVVLGRLGLWGERVRFAVFRWGAWTLTVVLLLVALGNFAAETSWERFAFAPLCVVLALLGAEGLRRRHASREAPTAR